MKKKNRHIGSSLDDFLKEEGIHEDATNYAVKRVLAWQVAKAMQGQRPSKTEMARCMGTSCTHLDKLLDPDDDKVQLARIFPCLRRITKRRHPKAMTPTRWSDES